MKYLPRKARLALHDWASRYSGLDKHMAEAHPVPGYLDWGDVRFTIRTVTFSDGMMHVVAEAGPSEAGLVSGVVRLTGTDDEFFMGGRQDKYMGTKTSASTWTFTWSVRMPAIADDDGLPPSGPTG